ncbi:MAG TPA: chromate efflux transporter [Roseiflexaceae bacterium]|nr:chromate efflux transporter [Roseiflexaceae bacterium]
MSNVHTCTDARSTQRQRLGELAAVFLKLGATGFGGLAVQIAMMEEEAVRRRGWLDHQAFLDLVGASNLVPGPNAVKVALQIGYARAGWPGFALAGGCFVAPAVLISATFAWIYQRFGALPQIEALLAGIKPAMLVVIAATVWKLGRTAITGWRGAALGLLVLAAALLGLSEALALPLGGLLGILWLRGDAPRPQPRASASALALAWLGTTSRPGLPGTALALGAGAAAAGALSLWGLGWFFLKVGAVLFGNGYVLIAFLDDLVAYGWLSERQLLDAVAVGQVTPGPLLSTATFIGYVLAGAPGAAVATLAIFLPSIAAVALLNPVLPQLRRAPWSRAFLGAVNICAVVLLGLVAARLAGSILIGWQPWAIAIVAAVLHIRWQVGPGWLVLGGALTGWLLAAF